jgi:hypothetical protein
MEAGTGFLARLGHSVKVREFRPEDREALLAMYRTFDAAQRAQALPPLTEERRPYPEPFPDAYPAGFPSTHAA